MYTYKQFDNRFVLSIRNHTEISEAIRSFCAEHNVKTGTVSGIGAVSEAVLRFFDPATKKYVDRTFSEQMEISDLNGNISQMDGQPYVHLHVTLGRADYTALAGHLMTAVINGAGEFVIDKLEGELGRYRDEDTGLNLFEF